MDRLLYACSQPHSLIVGYLALSIEPSAVSLEEFMLVVSCALIAEPHTLCSHPSFPHF
jgi:hypothetical protein